MVTTRSGKPVIAGFKPISQLSRSKKAVETIFIFEDATATETKKRESPCKLSKKDIKKTKVQPNIIDKENSINALPPPVSNLSEVKKIQISQDEKLMSGAPEGDLFDMVVFEDAELWPFANDQEAHDEFVKSCQVHKNSTIWADQYESVVIIRRVLLHHTDVIQNNSLYLTDAVTFAVEGVEALRSCRVRSGIMCLRALLSKCGAVLSSTTTTNTASSSSSSTTSPKHTHIHAIIHSLLTKTGSGPKFIVELALNTLLHEGVANLESFALISCLLPAISHKNPELAASAILTLINSVKKIDREVLGSCDEMHVRSLRDTVISLTTALNAKRPKAKEEARNTLNIMLNTTGDTQFRALLSMHLTETQTNEVMRTLAGPAATPRANTSTTTTPSSMRQSSGVASANHSRTVASASGAMRIPLSARQPLKLPSSAQTAATGSGFSKFKMQRMAQAPLPAGCALTEDFVCVAAPPRRMPLPPTPSPALSTTSTAVADRTEGAVHHQTADHSINASSTTMASAAATPSASLAAVNIATIAATPQVSSLRDHIMRMKQQQRLVSRSLQEQEQQPSLQQQSVEDVPKEEKQKEETSVPENC